MASAKNNAKDWKTTLPTAIGGTCAVLAMIPGLGIPTAVLWGITVLSGIWLGVFGIGSGGSPNVPPIDPPKGKG